MADALTQLKARLGEAAAAADPALLETLLDSARETILGYTNRARMPTALVGAQVELALIAYNQTGVEGEASHSEGGVSRSWTALTPLMQAQLNRYRLARVGGKAYEAEAEE
mgnify:FL=1